MERIACHAESKNADEGGAYRYVDIPRIRRI
jgi:hypothetical protein